MIRALRRVAVALVVSTVAAELTAQTPPAAVPRRIVPGDSSLRGSELRPDTLTYTLTGYRDGDEIPVGTITDILTRIEGPTPLWRRVMVVQRGMARLTDSSLTDARTLAPREHRSWQPQRQMQLEYTGTRIRGRIGPPDAPGMAIDTTLASLSFDSGNWDLVVRALPLAPGYVATFPVYSLETGAHLYGVRVIGATTLHGEQAHIVIFQLGGQREITVWIGAMTRRLLQVETPLGGTTLLRQSLRPAERSPGH
jgi:hypothetical protein